MQAAHRPTERSDYVRAGQRRFVVPLVVAEICRDNWVGLCENQGETKGVTVSASNEGDTPIP